MKVSAETGAAVMGYRPGLDAIRGVAVALVLVGHIFYFNLRFAGPVGVTVFLALSGFLITKLLLEERGRDGTVSLGGFYRRRGRRLLPALPPVLLVCAAVNAAHGFEVMVPVVSSLLYGQNIAVALGHTDGAFGHLWSLSLEEQFYALWPLAFVLVPAWRLRRVAIASVGVLLTTRLVLAGTAAGEFLLISGFSRVDQLLIGCALAWVLHERRWHPSRLLLCVAAGTILLLAVVGMHYETTAGTVGLSVCALATCPWIAAAANRPGSFSHPLEWLGRRAYGVYLWHVPVIWIIDADLNGGAVAAALIVSGTLGVAAASYSLIEQPILRSSATGQPRRP